MLRTWLAILLMVIAKFFAGMAGKLFHAEIAANELKKARRLARLAALDEQPRVW